MAFTREQVESIKVGTFLAWGFGDQEPRGRHEVTKITCKMEDLEGKLFVVGYMKWSDNSTISFAIKEGCSLDYKLYRIV